MEITVFSNEEFGEVRVAGTREKPMFCLADVCRVLEIGNVSDVKNRLKEDGVETFDAIDKLGRSQKASFINESNLYRLILRSYKPQAVAFQDWICDEVIPQIRKTGTYSMKDSYLIDDPIERAQVWIEEHKQLLLAQKQAEDNKVKAEQNQEKADYCDKILCTEQLFPVKMLALDYGMSAAEFNRLLEAFKIQYKQGKHWYLYKKYLNKGYVGTETYLLNTPKEVAMTMKWTQKGRQFLYEFLSDKGIKPVNKLF